MSTLARVAFVAALLLSGLAWAAPLALPADLPEASRKRFDVFQSFRIKGVCGDRDLESLAGTGVNTVRGYSIPSAQVARDKLDRAQRLNLKMIVSEFMPHQGPNKGRDGTAYEFDYNARADAMVDAFIKDVEAIGDHPAILMWGLGNEVHLDEPYLRVANRMSLAIHERFPTHLTSLTIVNAKPEKIALVKEFAPDIDVLGIQSYSRGAVLKAIKSAEEHWAKPFYVSEFNTEGPWHYAKSEWGMYLDKADIPQKVKHLKICYEAIDASPLCLGSTIFVWGHSTNTRPSDFSLLLDPDPNGPGLEATSFAHMYRTPQAEIMIEHFTGKPIEGNRAPMLKAVAFEGGAGARLVKPGELMRIEFAADDADGDEVQFVTWILDASSKFTKSVAGPLAQASASHAIIKAPETPGEFRLMVYAVDNRGGASASTLAFKVSD
jgi:hypothetical protein